jgi:hypothetical protein
MSFGVTIFARRNFPSDGQLTREDLKNPVHECDLALAEAKGKETWRLPPSEAQNRPSDKNTVVAFSRDWETKSHQRPTVTYREKLYREKRHFQRHYTSTIMMFRDNGQLRVGKTINLSLSGAKLLSDFPLPASRPIEIILILGEKARSLIGEVVYSQKTSPESTSFYTGLKFNELTPEDFQILESYFDQAKAETFN